MTHHRLLDWKLDLPHDAAVDVPGVGSDVLADDVLAEAVVVLDVADDDVVVADDDVVPDVEGVGAGAVSISTSSSSSSSFFILMIKLRLPHWSM